MNRFSKTVGNSINEKVCVDKVLSLQILFATETTVSNYSDRVEERGSDEEHFLSKFMQEGNFVLKGSGVLKQVVRGGIN
mgnify:CR=1 FL=1